MKYFEKQAEIDVEKAKDILMNAAGGGAAGYTAGHVMQALSKAKAPWLMTPVSGAASGALAFGIARAMEEKKKKPLF